MIPIIKMEHDFSVEINSKEFLGNVSISNKSRELVFFEGSLGETVELSLVEGDVLEIMGKYGVLRVSLSEGQLKRILEKHGQKKEKEGV